VAELRAFLAVPLPAALQQAILRLQRELAPRVGDLRWARPETLHLTLRFFGRITEEQLEKIAPSVLSVGVRQAPFEVRVRGLGAFPDPRRPRVLWLGLDPARPLHALYAECQAQLAAAGIAAEPRQFSPHLTLGRYRQRAAGLADLVAAYADRDLGPLPVEQLVLYESRLLPSGARHIPLHSIPLSGPPGAHR